MKANPGLAIFYVAYSILSVQALDQAMLLAVLQPAQNQLVFLTIDEISFVLLL